MTIGSKLHLALRHDNVLGRSEKIIHSSITQVDLHDFCRLCLTYGLAGFHCITEIEAQHRICGEILTHWREGYDPDRNQALSLLRLHWRFDAALNEIETHHRAKPLLIGTSARSHQKNIEYNNLWDIMSSSGRPAVIQFGTSWGLSPDHLRRCDWVLPPIEGHAGYNHLSVRCAAAIIVDRLLK